MNEKRWFVLGLLLGAAATLSLAATWPGQVKDGGVVMPFCRTDLSTTEGGFMCYDTTRRTIRHRGAFEEIR